jgi:hypothetical protein
MRRADVHSVAHRSERSNGGQRGALLSVCDEYGLWQGPSHPTLSRTAQAFAIQPVVGFHLSLESKPARYHLSSR